MRVMRTSEDRCIGLSSIANIRFDALVFYSQKTHVDRCAGLALGLFGKK